MGQISKFKEDIARKDLQMIVSQWLNYSLNLDQSQYIYVFWPMLPEP